MKNRKPLRHPKIIYNQGLFFVTILVRNHRCCLCQIEGGETKLSQQGKVVADAWNWLFDKYHYLEKHAFVVMPNHIHGLIEIRNSEQALYHGPQAPIDAPKSQKVKPLAELLGAFKTRSSKVIRLTVDPEFTWHKSYHAHKLFNRSEEYHKILKYIRANPSRWKEDDLWEDAP
jgi:hypothetical protein